MSTSKKSPGLTSLRKTLAPNWEYSSGARATGSSPHRKGRPLIVDDLYELRLVGDPQTSPDDTRIIAPVQHIDREANEYRAALWLFPADGSNPVQMTSGQWNDGSPRWSPDGARIAFLSKRNTSTAQIWVLPTNGGEASCVSDQRWGVEALSWAPDSRHIAFSATVAPEDFDAESDVRTITSARYKFDGRGFLDGKVRHIFTVDIEHPDRAPTRITTGDFDHGAPAWSPNGKDIAFIANRDPDWDMSRIFDIWTIPAAGGELRRLTDGRGSWHSLAWSPDGSKMAISGVPRLKPTWQHDHLYLLDAAGGTPRLLSGAIDRHIGDRSMSGPNGPAPGPSVRWTPDGKAVDALVSDRGSTQVVRFKAKSGDATVLTGSDRHVTSFSHIGDGSSLAIAATDSTTPSSLRLATPAGEAPLSHFNDAWLAKVGIATPEEFWFESNGHAIQGWLLRPVGSTPDGPDLPLILNVHGGPHTQFSPAFFHELQLYAARGFAVVFINPRGSLGYDESFARDVVSAWGEADGPDFLAAIDHVIALGGIDGKRVGITGGSYGGFITNWLLGTSNRFKVGVTDRSISNMISMYGTDDISLVSIDYELGTPWENQERYWELSPLKYVANISAPLLIIHSENDYRCPIEQAEQLFIALKKLGRTVEFVRFGNESHGLSRNGKPQHRVLRLERTLEWFERHL